MNGVVPQLDRSITVRLAIINMVGFAMAGWSATFLDARLEHHVLWNRARTYPMGFGILGFAPLLFLVTYLAVTLAPRRVLVMSWLPALATACIFCQNFKPEVPHAGFLTDIASYALLSFLTVFIAEVSQLPTEVFGASAGKPALVSRLEGAIKDWRTLLFVVATTYVLAALAWLQLIWPMADHLTENAAERWIVGTTFGAKLFIYSLFVMAGPIVEIHRGLRRHQKALFELEADTSSASPI